MRLRDRNLVIWRFLNRCALKTLFSSYNCHFLSYLAQNPMKVACSYDFLPIYCTQNWKGQFLNFKGRANTMSRWYLFWFWKEDIHSYIPTGNLGLYDFPYGKSVGEVAATTLQKICLEKIMLRRTRIKNELLWGASGDYKTRFYYYFYYYEKK